MDEFPSNHGVPDINLALLRAREHIVRLEACVAAAEELRLCCFDQGQAEADFDAAVAALASPPTV